MPLYKYNWPAPAVLRKHAPRLVLLRVAPFTAAEVEAVKWNGTSSIFQHVNRVGGTIYGGTKEVRNVIASRGRPCI